jgi:hypothetical protein
MAGTNWAFAIDTADEEAVDIGIADAPHYDVKIANALQRTIGIIHGLTELHCRRGFELGEFEVYLGRASATGGHVLDRWTSHRKNRTHKWGCVLFTCASSKAVRLEGLAIRVLKSLKDRGALCVGNANIANSGGGGSPSTRDSAVYMTWSAGEDLVESFEKPNLEIIREVAEEAAAAADGEIGRDQIANGLAALKRLSTYEPLTFFNRP